MKIIDHNYADYKALYPLIIAFAKDFVAREDMDDSPALLFVKASKIAFAKKDVDNCLLLASASLQVSSAEIEQIAFKNALQLAVKIEEYAGVTKKNAEALFAIVQRTNEDDDVPSTLLPSVVKVFERCVVQLLKNGVSPKEIFQGTMTCEPISEIADQANTILSPLLDDASKHKPKADPSQASRPQKRSSHLSLVVSK